MAENKIPVNHVNIRLSISFLLLKIIVLDLIAASIIIFYFSVLYSQAVQGIQLTFFSFHTVIFVFIGTAKVLLTVYLVLQWLNEYYEITPKSIIYKRGLLFRKSDSYSYDHIRSISLKQGIFGRFLNYGNIVLFDWDMWEFKTIYQVHNPKHYFKIIQELIPDADVERHVIREHIPTERE